MFKPTLNTKHVIKQVSSCQHVEEKRKVAGSLCALRLANGSVSAFRLCSSFGWVDMLMIVSQLVLTP